MNLLTLNAGSSSLKFALYQDDGSSPAPMFRLGGQVEGLGSEPRLQARQRGLTTPLADEPLASQGAGAVRDVADAMRLVLYRLQDWLGGEPLAGVGHRVVHGGPHYSAPALIDDAVLADLTRFVPLAPLHQPHNLQGIRAARERFPGVPQLACFDTAFHRGHDFIHDTYALPRELHAAGVRRYGFHGLSYEYIAQRLPLLDPAAAAGRTVVAHLGSGASLCAMHAGRSVASTMGFSALDGLPMGTRPGQLDPGVLLWLLTERGMDAAALTDLLYKRSGLKALSGVGNDMRVLHASAEPAAAEAIAYFVAQLCAQVGAMAATLGGLDALVFTAGIGEHDTRVRAQACARLGFLGVALDEAANRSHGAGRDGLISSGPTRVWVLPTDEEAMIARHLRAALRPSSSAP